MRNLVLVTGFVLLFFAFPRASSAQIITIFPDTPVTDNCFPFGSGEIGLPDNTWPPFMGFIYQNIPPFELKEGDILAFDLGVVNSVDVQLDIELAATTVNGGEDPVLPFVQVVSNTQTPFNPNGDTVEGDFEMMFIAEAPFSFPGGGLIIRFSNPSAAYQLNTNCEQVLVHGNSADTSGFFVKRFWSDPDGEPPYDFEDEEDIGAFAIFSSPPSDQVVFTTDEPEFLDDNTRLDFQDFLGAVIDPDNLLICPAPVDTNSDDDCFVPGQILPDIAFTDNPGPDQLVLLGEGFDGSDNPSNVLTNETFLDDFEILFDGDTDTVGLTLGCVNFIANDNACALQVDVHGPGDVLLGTFFIVVTDQFDTFLGVESDQQITRIVLSEAFMTDVRGLLFILFGLGGTGDNGNAGCAIAGAGVGPEGLAGLAVLALIPLFIVVRKRMRAQNNRQDI